MVLLSIYWPPSQHSTAADPDNSKLIPNPPYFLGALGYAISLNSLRSSVGQVLVSYLDLFPENPNPDLKITVHYPLRPSRPV